MLVVYVMTLYQL